MSNRTFNLYCDESCHLENDHKQFMLLGYINVPYNQLQIHKEAIENIKIKHNFYSEIKWSKVSHSKFAFYQELTDYFFSTDLMFRAIIIDKNKVNNNGFDQDFDTFYYKMYYQLIYHMLDMSSTYNIFLDIKDTLSKWKVKKLREVLQYSYSSIRTLQNIRSHESVFMQLADFFTGALNYNLNEEPVVTAKVDIIERIKSHSNHTLDCNTTKSASKFNLFFIELK